MPIKYAFISADILVKIDPDGIIRDSCHFTDPRYLEWVAEGNVAEFLGCELFDYVPAIEKEN